MIDHCRSPIAVHLLRHEGGPSIEVDRGVCSVGRAQKRTQQDMSGSGLRTINSNSTSTLGSPSISWTRFDEDSSPYADQRHLNETGTNLFCNPSGAPQQHVGFTTATQSTALTHKTKRARCESLSPPSVTTLKPSSTVVHSTISTSGCPAITSQIGNPTCLQNLAESSASKPLFVLSNGSVPKEYNEGFVDNIVDETGLPLAHNNKSTSFQITGTLERNIHFSDKLMSLDHGVSDHGFQATENATISSSTLSTAETLSGNPFEDLQSTYECLHIPSKAHALHAQPLNDISQTADTGLCQRSPLKPKSTPLLFQRKIRRKSSIPSRGATSIGGTPGIVFRINLATSVRLEGPTLPGSCVSECCSDVVVVRNECAGPKRPKKKKKKLYSESGGSGINGSQPSDGPVTSILKEDQEVEFDSTCYTGGIRRSTRDRKVVEHVVMEESPRKPKRSTSCSKRGASRESFTSMSADDLLKGNILVPRKECASCFTRSTPMWRDSPDGVPYCNACGIRYKKYSIRCNTCKYIPRKEEKSLVKCPGKRCTDVLKIC
eukprot:CFRG1175T1